MENGTDRYIAFASRTLAPVEKNYSQIVKEALGVVFAVKKFHRYLFGHKFTIVNDRQPLRRLFNAEKEVPTMFSDRIQRWALIFSIYENEFKYLRGTKIAHDDAMSRLPMKRKVEDEDNVIMPAEIIFMLKEEVGSLGVYETQIATRKSNKLQLVKKFIEEG